jgi:hypothetical protein
VVAVINVSVRNYIYKGSTGYAYISLQLVVNYLILSAQIHY